MSELKIDLDRGVMQKAYEAIDVYMYIDDPGVYLNAYATPVTEAIARAAGFDVEKYAKLRQRKLLLQKAQAQIEAQLALEPDEETVIEEVKGFKLVDIGLGRVQIRDPEGGFLLNSPVTKEMGTNIFKEITAEPEAPAS